MDQDHPVQPLMLSFFQEWVNITRQPDHIILHFHLLQDTLHILLHTFIPILIMFCHRYLHCPKGMDQLEGIIKGLDLETTATMHHPLRLLLLSQQGLHPILLLLLQRILLPFLLLLLYPMHMLPTLSYHRAILCTLQQILQSVNCLPMISLLRVDLQEEGESRLLDYFQEDQVWLLTDHILRITRILIILTTLCIIIITRIILMLILQSLQLLLLPCFILLFTLLSRPTTSVNRGMWVSMEATTTAIKQPMVPTTAVQVRFSILLINNNHYMNEKDWREQVKNKHRWNSSSSWRYLCLTKSLSWQFISRVSSILTTRWLFVQTREKTRHTPKKLQCLVYNHEDTSDNACLDSLVKSLHPSFRVTFLPISTLCTHFKADSHLIIIRHRQYFCTRQENEEGEKKETPTSRGEKQSDFQAFF